MIIVEKAYAKLNLMLDVLNIRDDGFHDILSIMHSVSLCDILTVNAEPSDKTSISIVILNNDDDLPTDERNLIYRGASAYLSYFGITANVKIELEKHIPVAAGLAGGSSDAAATIRALNRIFHLAFPRQLAEIAAGVGSDVTFCLWGGLCACGGRGETVAQLPYSENLLFIIAIGKSRTSTKEAYAKLDRRFENFTIIREDSFERNDKVVAFMRNCASDFPKYNIFEEIENGPEVEEIKKILIKNGADYAMMSGSGPAVFGYFKNDETAMAARDKLLEKGYSVYVTRSAYIEDYI